MGPLRRLLTGWLRRFAREEAGSMAIYGLFTFVTCCAVGAIALDVTHMYAARTQLQAASDAAAHAALYTRREIRLSETEAKRRAIALLQHSLPARTFGRVIDPSDITFGTYDATTGVFTPRRNSTEAVRVRVERAGNSGNPVATFLFRMVGVRTMDVRAETVFTTVGDPCATMQGVFAVGAVTPNSNNSYSSGFCVYSQTRVAEQNDPAYASGASVAAPNLANVTCQNKCTSFDQAKRSASYDLNPYLDPIRAPANPAAETGADLLADVRAAMPAWTWTGIDPTVVPMNLPSKKSDTITPASVQGKVVYIECRASGDSAQLDGTYRKTILLLHGCAASMKDVVLEDSIVYTTNTDSRNSIAIHGWGSLILGTDADCNGSGSAAILTRGGFDAPAKLKFQGGSVRALLDVKMAAQFGYAGKGDSGQGVSIVTGGTIDPTSNNDFRACPPPPGAAPTLVTFHLAR